MNRKSAARCDALTLALEALTRGWHPVPLTPGTKTPIGLKWQRRKVTRDNVSKYFGGDVMVGLQMGPKSNGLCDTDLDCTEAIALAPHFLPQTGARYGRASKRESHRLYYIGDAELKGWIAWRDDQKKVILELKLGGGNKGSQCVMPGSVHTSGELYEWDARGEPARSSCAELKAACIKVAAGALLMRHWPVKGALHDCALTVGGFLARAGWKPGEIEQFVHVINSKLRGINEPKKHAKTARDSAEHYAKGGHVGGLPKMCEFFGDGVVNAVARIIGYHKDDGVEAAKNSEQGTEGVTLADFHAYMVQHNYIYAPAREMWPAGSVNARIPPIVVGVDADGNKITILASVWLDRRRPVEMITWAPGLPLIIRDRLISEGGWIERKKVACFNLYRPPTIELGDATKAKPWVDLVHKVFPEEAKHIIYWFAHRRQRPWEKINHGLVLGSQEQGIGKDTILEGVKRAIAPWNFKEVLPAELFESFNPFVRAVILRINEAKDMGDVTRFEFYEHTKSYLAAPPDVLPCNEKHIKQHYVLNCMGVVITTNHLTDGIYLPAEDRRHYVAWSEITKEAFKPNYWNDFYKWLDNGGDRHVAAYLATLDLSHFDPKAPPKKTPAFWSIVNANRTTEEGELQDALDQLGNPDAVTINEITDKASLSFMQWLDDRKNRKAVAHRLETCGYRAVNNPVAKDGMWRIDQRRQMVYAKVSLPLGEQLKAAEALQRRAAEGAAKKAEEAAKGNGKPKPRVAMRPKSTTHGRFQ